MNDRTTLRRATPRLAVGAGLGVALAACGLLLTARNEDRAMTAEVVARVNGQPIALADYRQAVSTVANARRDSLGEADRRRIVDHLIDEELLVQRGLELGLAHTDRKVRTDLTTAVISTAAVGGSTAEPSAAEVEKYYQEHGARFATAARIRVREIFFHSGASPDESLRLANEAVRRIRAGEPFEKVRDSIGDPEVSPLPDALLPPSKVVEYIGPAALRAAMSLAPGQVSDPVQSGQGLHVMELLERDTTTTPPLADVRSAIVAELRRRRTEAALRSYLDRLRRDARI